MKSAVETLSPTRAKITVEVPFEELKPSLDAAYQAHRQADQHPRLPQGQGPAAGDRPPGRPRRRPRRGDQRRAAQALRAGAAGQRPPAAGAAGDRRHQARGQRAPRVHRRGRRPARRSRSRRTTASACRSTTSTVSDDDVDEQVEALRERFATLKDVERPAQDGDVVTIDLIGHPRRRAVEGGEVSGYSYKVGSGDMLEGIDEALRRPERRRGEDLHLAAARRRPVRRGRRGHGQAVARSRSRSCPSSTTSSPRPRRSSTPSTSCATTCATRLERGKRLEQAAAARDAVLEKLLDSAEIPLPDERRRPRSSPGAARRSSSSWRTPA